MDGHLQPAVAAAHWQDQVLAHQVRWDRVGEVRRDRRLVHLDELKIVLRRQRLVDVGLSADL